MNAFILSTDSELRALVNRLCAMRNPAVTVLPALPSMNTDTVPAAAGQPDLVIFDASGYPGDGAGMLQKLGELFPQAGIMLLSSDRSPAYLIEAMRAGVREVLPLPLAAAELDAALDRFMQKFAPAPHFDGKVMAFMASKGGSGATFVAANLAHALSQLGQKRTLLIDMNPLFGDAALYVSDAKSARTLADICQDINRLDANLLESSVIRVSPNFSILAAADQPEASDDIRPDQVEKLLQMARRHYDFVLLDIGRQLTAVTIRALDQSDVIYPMLQQSLPHLRDGRRLADILASLGYRREKIQLVINRFESSAPLHLSEIERALDMKVAHRVPNHYETAIESINQGMPVLELARGSPISKSLADWVNRLVEPNSSPRASIIRRIFVRNPSGAEVTK